MPWTGRGALTRPVCWPRFRVTYDSMDAKEAGTEKLGLGKGGTSGARSGNGTRGPGLHRAKRLGRIGG